MLNKWNKTVLYILIAVVLAWCSKSTFAAESKSTFIAQTGKAVLPVVVSATASADTKALAQTLADYLGKISGGAFKVETGDGETGLAVGTAADFPHLPFKSTFDPSDPTQREDFILRSHPGGIYLIGSTDLAVSHAVWNFLYRLGYRDFFPGKHWEVIPQNANLALAVDVTEHPDFYQRRIWYGFGDWPDQGKDKQNWDARNLMGEGLNIRNGHAYQAIIADNKQAFAEHPEYLANPQSTKFCVSNPGLQQLVINWALKYFEKNPNADSISLEPSDGGGWDSPADACPDAKVYPNITDRVVTLANLVAEAVNKKFHNKYVGIYAYFSHSAPPTIKVNPHVAVGVATAFSAGFDNIAPGWKKQGAVIGVREYYDVMISSKGLPGAGPNFLAIANTIRNQYQMGARFMSAESSDNWGPTGLTYYLAAHLLWNTQADPQALIDDFFEKAFGAAQKPMRDFYEMVRRDSPVFKSQYKIGRMYRDIAEAQKLTNDPHVQQRLNDLTLYTRYAEMVQSGYTNSGQTQAETLLSYTYRIRDSHMVHNYALWRDSRNWNHGALRKTDESWMTPEGKNPLKNSTPYTQQEIDTIIQNGIAANPAIDFQPVAYSTNLVPATSLQLKTPGRIGENGYSRSNYHFYIWVSKAPATLKFTVAAGYVGTNDKPATLQLHAGADAESNIVATANVPKDKQPHTVELKSTFPGLQRVDVSSGGNAAHVSWPDGTPVVFASSPEDRITLAHRIDMYFYVPKGTTVVGGYAQGVGNVLDGNGKKVFEFTRDKFNNGGYFNIPVAPGQDGKLWEFTSSAGPRYLMTVPPYLTRSAEELMLPGEVVKADAIK